MRSRYWIRLVYEAVVVVALASSSLWVLYLQNSFQLGADFAPVWTAAAQLSSAYDIAAITKTQPDFPNLGQQSFARSDASNARANSGAL